MIVHSFILHLFLSTTRRLIQWRQRWSGRSRSSRSVRWRRILWIVTSSTLSSGIKVKYRRRKLTKIYAGVYENKCYIRISYMRYVCMWVMYVCGLLLCCDHEFGILKSIPWCIILEFGVHTLSIIAYKILTMILFSELYFGIV